MSPTLTQSEYLSGGMCMVAFHVFHSSSLMDVLSARASVRGGMFSTLHPSPMSEPISVILIQLVGPIHVLLVGTIVDVGNLLLAAVLCVSRRGGHPPRVTSIPLEPSPRSASTTCLLFLDFLSQMSQLPRYFCPTSRLLLISIHFPWVIQGWNVDFKHSEK